MSRSYSDISGFKVADIDKEPAASRDSWSDLIHGNRHQRCNVKLERERESSGVGMLSTETQNLLKSALDEVTSKFFFICLLLSPPVECSCTVFSVQANEVPSCKWLAVNFLFFFIPVPIGNKR